MFIDNAVKHGQGKIYVRLEGKTFCVENLSTKPVEESMLGDSLADRRYGVGLYIASRLCKVLGWTISLRQQKEGTLYRINFTINVL